MDDSLRRWQEAVARLESATASVRSAPLADLKNFSRALRERDAAVRQIADLTSNPDTRSYGSSFLERLRSAFDGGAEVRRTLLLTQASLRLESDRLKQSKELAQALRGNQPRQPGGRRLNFTA